MDIDYGIKLSEYAKRVGVQYNTAWRHFVKGLIPGAYRLPTGRVVVPITALQKLQISGRPKKQ